MSSMNLAVRSLTRRRTRTILTVSGIVIGVAMILVLLSVSAGASTQTNGLLRNALGAQITVVNATTPKFPGFGNFTGFSFTGGAPGGSGGAGGFAQFFGGGNTLNESLVTRIDDISGVYATSPELDTTGYVNGNSVLLDGINASTFSSVTDGVDVTSGSMFAASSPSNSIVLSSALASNLGVSVGSTVTVGANSTGGSSYTVTGIYTPATSAFGPASRSAYIPISAAQEISGKSDQVTEVYVKADDPGLVNSVASLIDSEISGVTANTASSIVVASSLSGTLSTLFIVVGVVALIAGAFGVINTMMMSISERTREVGTLRAIGAQKQTVMKIFMSEAFMIGVIGAVAGVVIGLIVSVALPSITGSGAASAAGRFAGARLISTLNTAITPENVLLSLGLGIVVGTLAGVYPAWRASRMDPVEALRHV
jgi:putative ABC transport system permease protein